VRWRALPATTLLLAGSAVVVHIIPGAGEALVFDRGAIAAGQWWRVVTGSWVHFSTAHLVYDVTACAVATWLLERERAPRVVLIWLVAALSIGLTVLFGMTEPERFGGLSGIAYALVTTLALRGLSERGAWRYLCMMTLAAAGAKLTYELATGHFLFVSTDDAVVPLPVTHAVGIASAVMLWAGARLRAAGPGWRVTLTAGSPS
jgi:rhomboid family GlyGly-CTERM serine protease